MIYELESLGLTLEEWCGRRHRGHCDGQHFSVADCLTMSHTQHLVKVSILAHLVDKLGTEAAQVDTGNH